MTDTLPTGQEVEKLSVTMATALGLVWTKVDKDTADQLRIAANAVLVHHGLHLLQSGRERVAAMVADAARGQREAIAALTANGVLTEDQLKALYRSASTTELVAAALDSGADDLPADGDAEF